MYVCASGFVVRQLTKISKHTESMRYCKHEKYRTNYYLMESHFSLLLIKIIMRKKKSNVFINTPTTIVQ